jgi:diguanylate cyclase (GGDEF)-like protein
MEIKYLRKNLDNNQYYKQTEEHNFISYLQEIKNCNNSKTLLKKFSLVLGSYLKCKHHLFETHTHYTKTIFSSARSQAEKISFVFSNSFKSTMLQRENPQIISTFTFLNIPYNFFLITVGNKKSYVYIWQASLQKNKYLQILIEYFTSCLQWIDKFIKLEQQAYFDDLTGLHNSRYLKEILNSEFKRYKRYKQEFSALFVDIDSFKRINDNYGHNNGDRAIKAVADLLTNSIRASDTIVRYGGDEYVIILINTNTTGAQKVAQRICKNINTTHFLEPINLSLTLSIGIASCPIHALSTTQILNKADKSMYISKKNGGNCYTLCQER